MGLRRLFARCCEVYEITPEEMCELIRYKTLKTGLSIDDMQIIREVLLEERDLGLEEATRIGRRFEGKTPILDALQELLAEAQDG